MKYIIKHITFLFALLISLLSYGQSDNFQTFGVEMGLIQSQVECVEQDERGYLWIGTIGGLTIYNGYQFKSFTTKEGLSEDWISTIDIGQDGNIWLGHWAGGITVYNPEIDSFSKLNVESYTRYRKINKIIDVEGTKYIGVAGAGIVRYKDEKYTRVNLDSSLLNVEDLVYDKKNQIIWATCSGKLLWIDVHNNTLNAVINVNQALDSTYYFNQIALGNANEVWVGTKNKGVLRFNLKEKPSEIISNNTLSQYVKNLSVSDGLTSNEINTLKFSEENSVWIGTEQGINVFRIDENRKDSLGFNAGQIEIFSNEFELKYFIPNCFFEDREHNIWIGSEVGLSKYRGELFTIYDQRGVMTNNLCWSTLEDKNGNIWAGTSKGINNISFNQTKNGKDELDYYNPFKDTIPLIDSLSSSVVISMVEDNKGKIWMGTESKGINIYNQELDIVVTLNSTNGLTDDHIYSLCKDEKGNIWVGTQNGASYINITDTFLITNYWKKDGLGGDKIYKVFKDSKNTIWFGVLGGYLTKFENGQFHTFTESDGLNNKFTLSIDEDENGEMWFGNYLGGVYHYNGKQFRNFSLENGLSSNSPHFVLCDQRGSVWVGHNKGVDKIAIVNGDVSKYTKQHGIKGLETNENSASLDHKGNIWFGSIKGLIKLSPQNERPNLVEPITAIEGLKIKLKDAEFPEDHTFKYDENELNFDVIGVSLTNPEEVSYSYMLEGGFATWSPRIKKRSISFSGLTPGEYTFRLKAYNNHGIESKNEISYHFIISPPFYETLWFKALAIVMIALSIFTFMKVRERKMRKTQIYLEEQVELRTEEIRDQKEVIEAKNHHITSSINYSKRIQDSILPPEDLILESLPNHFVYFNPRDIVSGDFYWVHKIGNKVLYATSDCTGHGVPGAFMSLIGHNLLEKIVNEYKITEPAKILDKLSEEIIVTLRQNTGSNVKDGMDISICSVDFGTNKLEFAGAYNPLYIIRNGELIVAEADQIAIGKSYSGVVEPYTNHKLEILKGDCLYTFSDGYVDQFGGSKGKKFLTKRFKKLLVEVAELPIDQQKDRLDEVMTRWMGDRKQLDDMIIFGVQV